MEFFTKALSDIEIFSWDEFNSYWFFYFSMAFFAFELIRYLIKKQLTLRLVGDTITNFITLTAFSVSSYILLGAFYLTAYTYLSQIAFFQIPSTWLTVIACIVLADLAYYWEHRFMHRMNFAWATHTVHHSSPHFNISVAYRFGPMDGVWPFFFHAPLVLLGFNPFVVFFAENLVQFYQTILHTESIKKLPKPFEAVMNTPSHHRVHHASNQQYLDTNYAGIFIIWDKMFGTFAEEKEEVVYGLVEPIPEINSPTRMLASPFVAYFHGFYRLAKKISHASGLGTKLAYFFAPPEWVSKEDQEKQSNSTTPAE